MKWARWNENPSAFEDFSVFLYSASLPKSAAQLVASIVLRSYCHDRLLNTLVEEVNVDLRTLYIYFVLFADKIKIKKSTGIGCWSLTL